MAARSSGRSIDRRLRLTVNFHPDRTSGGRPVIAALADDGRYRSQWETGTSNGSLTAHLGGDRSVWEHRMFGGAYDDAPTATRPIYGALDLAGRPAGAAPRFGSAALRLTEAVLDRATFCHPDSVFDPVHFGVAGRMGLLDHLSEASDDPLDRYVEAQIHGSLLLGRDVEAVILDPCFGDTSVGRAADRLPCPVEWHAGYRAHVDTIAAHPAYRGPEVVALAARVAEDGWLDARIVGNAAATGMHDPNTVKRLWHCVARFG